MANEGTGTDEDMKSPLVSLALVTVSGGLGGGGERISWNRVPPGAPSGVKFWPYADFEYNHHKCARAVVFLITQLQILGCTTSKTACRQSLVPDGNMMWLPFSAGVGVERFITLLTDFQQNEIEKHDLKG